MSLTKDFYERIIIKYVEPIQVVEKINVKGASVRIKFYTEKTCV